MTVPSERDDQMVHALASYAAWRERDADNPETTDAMHGYLAGYCAAALEAQHTRDEEARAIVRDVAEWWDSKDAYPVQPILERARAYVEQSDQGEKGDASDG